MGYGPTFRSTFEEMQHDVHQTAKEKGWWDGMMPDDETVIEDIAPRCIALMHSELSECLEAFREGNPASEKGFSSRRSVPDEDGDWVTDPLTCAEEELADVVIRVMDFAEFMGFDIASAIEQKAEYNKRREHKHGGKVF